ncbi:ATP-binding protein [Methylomarinum vadi]|uniref:ATP-binding protein n=1 Tax=Methylomarinum vadi TaxID=438855 RepID=UPI002E11F8F6
MSGWLFSFIIEDTGCGISSDHQELVFSPFIQINQQDFSREGVGLGLAITYELVRLLGGTISLSSHPGQGSTFTVRLPRQEAAEQKPLATVVPRNEVKPSHGLRLLVADDNELNNHPLKRVGSNNGLKVRIRVD